MSGSVRIRMAEPGDREVILRLLGEMHGAGAADRYEWLYLRNPHGRALTWLAVDESSGDVVGMTSLFPRFVYVGGKTELGALGGDSYVVPAARGRGLATRLHLVTREEMGRNGVQVAYGAPVPINLRALLAAGARVVSEFRRFTLLLGPSSARRPDGATGGRTGAAGLARALAEKASATVGLLSRLALSRAITKYTISSVAEFGQEWDDWIERLRWSYPVACVRDRRYLTWRYLESPRRTQVPFVVRRDERIVGLLVLEARDARCAIVDLFVERSLRLLRVALALAALRARAMGCDAVDFSCTEFPGHRLALTVSGFVLRERSAPWMFHVLDSGDSERSRFLGGRRNWYATAGDQDVT
ncbi:MAG TPA: GNAT family N-acetyltransferase [Gemmatimonadales bacterium]|nr:GNAT family N-acetyltransferase [Gemmatimonadales bacterium]